MIASPLWRHCAMCGSALRPALRPDLKPACQSCGWFRPTHALPVALVLAHTVDRRIVLARRNSWPPGAWALIAGFIEVGETAEEAALRELEEETGLIGSAPRVHSTLSGGENLLVCVTVEIGGGIPQARSDIDEVLLGPGDPERIPAGWPARKFVEYFLRS